MQYYAHIKNATAKSALSVVINNPFTIYYILVTSPKARHNDVPGFWLFNQTIKLSCLPTKI